MLNHLFEKIEEFDSIVLFRHVLPDMDAIGSQLGLKEWIKGIYPNKDVYALGSVGAIAPELAKELDQVSDDIIKKSLAIVLDTSMANRVDDDRLSLAKYSIRIDHHVPIDEFCDWEYIDQEASATCEILALAAKENQVKLPQKAAQLLYSGLISDNIRFTTSNTRPQSFEAAGYLFQFGVDVVEVESLNFGSNYSDYLYENKVREKSIRKGNVLYSIMTMEDYKDITFPQAKEKVYALSGIREIKTWALFTEREPGIYNASLRSKRLDIRQVAQQYNGGGHICASGIKMLTLEQIEQIVEKLEALAQ